MLPLKTFKLGFSDWFRYWAALSHTENVSLCMLLFMEMPLQQVWTYEAYSQTPADL